jgi:hypothetical protein
MSFRKAILVNPPNPPGFVSNKDSMGGFGQLYHAGAPPLPPLDMPYLAAVVGEHGFEVSVIEAGALGLSVAETVAAVRRAGPDADALVLLRTSLPTIDWDLGFAAELRAQLGGAGLGIFGPAVSSLLARVQRESVIDVAIMGEPDLTVLELLRGDPPERINGLAYRRDGEWRRNADRVFQRDLDQIPFPRWDLLPVDAYRIPRSAAAGTMRFLPMLTSRGCPFGCNYCPYPVGQGLKWRFRSPVNVVDEMEHLVRDLGVEYIIFRDPLFSANKKRVAEICEEVIRRGVTVQWRCETRIDCLDEPTIALMARAGCTGVNFGVESVDPQIQKNVERKPIGREQFVDTIAHLHRHRIATFAFFIVGLPGDTVDTILDTVGFALDIKPAWTQFTVSTPFIGTKLHAWAVGSGLIASDHYQIISSHEGSIGNENLTPAQVHQLHRFAQILARNLINRRGILKNESRRDLPYRLARVAASAVAIGVARAAFVVARVYFRRRFGPPGPRAPSMAAAGQSASAAGAAP